MRFAQQTVLITGASEGVGLATARRFLEEGANVVLVARRPGPLAEAAASLGEATRVLHVAADVCDTAAMDGVVQQTLARFGGVDGLVNNAGAHFRGLVADREAHELGTMVDVNLRAPIVLTRQVLPQLLERRGFVVNVASLAGKVPLDGAATYSATKFALRAFTIALGEELRDQGVRVSVVSPGPIDTGFIMDDLDEVADIVFSQAMCGADDVAGMIVECAADGRREREYPVGGAKLATLGYLLPGLRRLLRPALVAKGRRVKDRLRRDRSSDK